MDSVYHISNTTGTKVRKLVLSFFILHSNPFEIDLRLFLRLVYLTNGKFSKASNQSSIQHQKTILSNLRQLIFIQTREGSSSGKNGTSSTQKNWWNFYAPLLKQNYMQQGHSRLVLQGSRLNVDRDMMKFDNIHDEVVVYYNILMSRQFYSDQIGTH